MNDNFKALRKWANDPYPIDLAVKSYAREVQELLAERDALEVQRDKLIEAATDAAHRYWELMEEKNRYREALEEISTGLHTIGCLDGTDVCDSCIARSALKDAEPRDEGL